VLLKDTKKLIFLGANLVIDGYLSGPGGHAGRDSHSRFVRVAENLSPFDLSLNQRKPLAGPKNHKH